MTGSCDRCGWQVEVSDSGQKMPCKCMVRSLDAFLEDCIADCIEGKTYGFGTERDDPEGPEKDEK